MSKYLTILLFLFSANIFAQTPTANAGKAIYSDHIIKDSTQWVYVTSNVHNGLCCWMATDSFLLHYNFRDKNWSLITDDVLDKIKQKRGIK